MFLEYVYCLIYVMGLSFCLYNYLDIKPKLIEYMLIVLIYAFFNFFVTNTISFQVLDQLLMNILVLVVDFIFISILNKKINISIINYIVFYNIIYSFLISFSLFFMNNFFNQIIEKVLFCSSYRSIFIIFINLVTILIWHFLKINNILVKKNVNSSYFMLFFNVNIISTIILLIFQYFSYTIKLNLYINLLLIIFTFLWFSLIYFINKYASLSYEHEHMLFKESVNNAIEQYMIQYNDSQVKINKFRHDIKNHFIILKEIRNIKQVNNYIDKIYPELESIKISNEYVSGHLFIDSIINSRIIMYKNVHFNSDFYGLNSLNMNEVDLSSLLFNLLDNAFYAANSINGFVNLQLKYDGEHLIIKIENSCEGKTNFKSNKKNHGYGLKIVNDIVDKYNGHIDMVSDNNLVVIKVGLEIL